MQLDLIHSRHDGDGRMGQQLVERLDAKVRDSDGLCGALMERCEEASVQ